MHVNKATPLMKMAILSPKDTFSRVYQSQKTNTNHEIRQFVGRHASEKYEGCSNMNASSFITFFTYMLRQNVIHFWKELFFTFKMTPNIKKHSLYFSSYKRLYKGYACILKFSEANCNARFGTCADIVSYLCKF